MKRLVAIAVVVLSFASAPACAQALRRGPVTQGGVTPGDMSWRLNKAADAAKKQGRTLDRAIEVDICYPQDRAEFDRLGGNAIVLLSAVTREASELPLQRAYAAVNGAEIPLVSIGAVRHDALNNASMRNIVGAYREDRFYLAPVSALAREGFALVDWAANRTGFRFYRLPSRTPEWMLSIKAPDGAKADPAAITALLKREYPGFDIK